jgi:hypothetical protein
LSYATILFFDNLTLKGEQRISFTPTKMTKILRTCRRRKRKSHEEEHELDVLNNFNHGYQNRSFLKQLSFREISSAFPISCQSRLPRKVSFLSLRTPPTEAVLGLDDSGDFVISVESHHLFLDVILRAIPSQAKPYTGAILVRRIHLPCPIFTDESSSVAEVPIEIILFGAIGVARIETYEMNPFDTEDDEIDTVRKGTIALFQIHTGCTLACNNTLLGTKKSSITLWKVDKGPLCPRDQIKWSCSNFIVEKLHILVHDEDDGFRLTWIDIEGKKRLITLYNEAEVTNEHYSAKLIDSKRDFWTVDTTLWQSDNSTRMIVLSGAHLSIEFLLQDIRARRPHVFFYKENEVPTYAYHLIQIDTSGRFLTCVLTFSNDNNSLQGHSTRTTSSVAVILQVNLFHNSYMELEWAQKRSSQTECQLDLWCQQLAITFRRKELQIDPPKETSIRASSNQTRVPSKDWKFEFEDRVKIVNGLRSPKSCVPDLSVLYPPFSTLSNIAVRRGLPVHSLTCQSGNTELVYFRNHCAM